MPYINPKTVLSPKNVVSNVDVVFDSKAGGFSVARLNWKGRPALGIRWNGDNSQSIGNPQSRGNPTWFIVPEDLVDEILKKAEQLSHGQLIGLERGYRAMADDQEREREATEWIDGLAGETLG